MESTFLIFGGNSELAKVFHSLYPTQTKLIDKSTCDITKKNDIESVLKKYNNPYILNCAAITDIALCEKNPKLCLEVNTIGVANLQIQSIKYNRKLIHVSSDYAAYPINMYGLSKQLSEQIMDKNDLVIRTNFYSRKSFAIKLLLNNMQVHAYTNVYFNPLSIFRVAHEIFKKRNKKGVLNLFTQEKISYYTFAQKVSNVLSLDNNLINKTIFKKVMSTYPRPMNSYVESDILVSLDEDLKKFKNLLLYDNYR